MKMTFHLFSRNRNCLFLSVFVLVVASLFFFVKVPFHAQAAPSVVKNITAACSASGRAIFTFPEVSGANSYTILIAKGNTTSACFSSVGCQGISFSSEQGEISPGIKSVSTSDLIGGQKYSFFIRATGKGKNDVSYSNPNTFTCDSTDADVVAALPVHPKSPVGNLDTALSGWACDPDDFSQPTAIHLYADGPLDGGGTPIGVLFGSVAREQGVANACGGNTNHGFSVSSLLQDGKEHKIYAYAKNIGSGNDVLLTGSPQILAASVPGSSTPSVPTPTVPTPTTPNPTPAPVPSSPVVIFTRDNRIQTTASVNVRSSGTTVAPVIGNQPQGARGTLKNSPVTADGRIWWYVDYDTGMDGWSAEDFMTYSVVGGAIETPPNSVLPPLPPQLPPTPIPTPTPATTPIPTPVAPSFTGSISASPQTCTIPSSASSCAITISWNSNSGNAVLDRVDADGSSNPTSFAAGSSGSQSVNFGTTGYYFRIFSDSSKTKLLAATPLLKGVAGVAPTHVSPPPPPASSFTGTISASPNSCTIPSGANSCSITISWSSNSANAVVDRVDSDGSSNPTLFSTGSSGSQSVQFGTTPYYFRIFSDSSKTKFLGNTPLLRGVVETSAVHSSSQLSAIIVGLKELLRLLAN